MAVQLPQTKVQRNREGNIHYNQVRGRQAVGDYTVGRSEGLDINFCDGGAGIQSLFKPDIPLQGKEN